jgi:hypothetical protein
MGFESGFCVAKKRGGLEKLRDETIFGSRALQPTLH